MLLPARDKRRTVAVEGVEGNWTSSQNYEGQTPERQKSKLDDQEAPSSCAAPKSRGEVLTMT